MEDSEIRSFLDLRERQCRIERRALEMWLEVLSPLRWATVIGGVIFSALGSAALFGATATVVGGVCSLIAAILTGIHTGLRCDAHHAECHRLVHLYASLEAGYQAARVVSGPELEKQHRKLEERFQEAKAKATTSPSDRYRKEAEKEDANQNQRRAIADDPTAAAPSPRTPAFPPGA